MGSISEYIGSPLYEHFFGIQRVGRFWKTQGWRVDFLSIAVFQEHRAQVKFNIDSGWVGSGVEMGRKKQERKITKGHKEICVVVGSFFIFME